MLIGSEGQDELKDVDTSPVAIISSRILLSSFQAFLFWKSKSVKENFMGPAYYMSQIKPVTKAPVLSLSSISFKPIFPSHLHCAREILSSYIVLSYLV